MNDQEQKKVWDFEDEDTTLELVKAIRNSLYEANYPFALNKDFEGDEFSAGLRCVICRISEIKSLERVSQVKLLKMGYCQLADDMEKFSNALRSTAEREAVDSNDITRGEYMKLKYIDPIKWNEVKLAEIKYPFAFLVKDICRVIFFWEIEKIIPEIIRKDRIWFFDHVPVNSPGWAIGNMPIKSAIIRVKQMVQDEGWELIRTEADELKRFVV